MTFGKRLRESRNAKNMTQKQLADLVGAKHNSISDWENDKNKPDPDTIELLCGVLDISPNYLLNTGDEAFSSIEKDLIKKYRALDPYGKEMIDYIIEKEFLRCETESTPAKLERQKENTIKRFAAYGNNLMAAHNDHLQEEGELEKVRKDIASLKRPE